jgi:DNA-binding IclR family transcriptional regulator
MITRPSLSTSEVKSAARVIDLLELLSNTDGLTVTEIQKRTGMPYSSVHGLVKTLERRGYLSAAADGRTYHFGLKVLELRNFALQRVPFVAVLRPYLEALSREVGQNVYLGIGVRNDFMYVDKVEVPQPVGLRFSLGSPRPIHSTAVGKCLLAFTDDAKLLEYVRTSKLVQVTPATITDPKKLAEDLARTRERGYALSDEESISGVMGIAAPIKRSTRGPLVAVVGVAVFKTQLPPIRDRLIRALVRAAKRMSSALSDSASYRGGAAGSEPSKP